MPLPRCVESAESCRCQTGDLRERVGPVEQDLLLIERLRHIVDKTREPVELLVREVPLVDEVLIPEVEGLLCPGVDACSGSLQRLEVLKFHRLRQPLQVCPRLSNLVRGERRLRLLAEGGETIPDVALGGLLLQLIGPRHGIKEGLVLREPGLLVRLRCRQPRRSSELLSGEGGLQIRLTRREARLLIGLLGGKLLLGPEFLDPKGSRKIPLVRLLERLLIGELRLQIDTLVRTSGIEERLLIRKIRLLSELRPQLLRVELLTGPQLLDSQ